MDSEFKRFSLTRPSYFRTVQLADFCAYMDKIIQNLESYIFKHHKQSNKAEERVKPSYRASRLLTLLNEKSLFSKTTQALSNIFAARPKPLSENAKKDLLSITEIGQTRFLQYLKQYFLQIDPKQKRDKKKLNTFSEKNTTKRGQKTKLNTATVLLKLAYRELESHNVNFIQTSPYPLALCTDLRKRNKSAFKNALIAFPEFKCMFVDKCPLCPGSLEIILDFLKYMHEPVPPNIKTVGAYAQYLYNKLVGTLGFNRGADCVCIIVDKCQYLPPPRDIVHEERKVDFDNDQNQGQDHEYTSEDPISKIEHDRIMKSSHKKSQMILYIIEYFYFIPLLIKAP